MAVVPLLFGFLCLIRGAYCSVCSAENIQSDVTSCLNQVKAGLTNKNSFYFGTQYSSLCGLGFASPMICYSANGSVVDSISTRVYPSRPGMDLTLLTKYLNMEFIVQPGNYTACGNTFVIDQTWTKRIDPTEAFAMNPAYSRYLPRLSWETTPGELYTLIVYDVGVSITHGIYININGNDIASSDIIDPYHGPLTTTQYIRNAYIFMVFRQASGRLTLSQDWLDKINAYYGTVSYTIEELANDNNLIGPVAANWIEVVGDEYAAQSMFDQKILVTCPIYVGKALSGKPRPFIPQPVSLSVSVDVQFSSDALNFTMCCKTHTYSAQTISTNPIGNGVVPTALVRSDVHPSFIFRKKGFYTTSTNFGDVKYTLVTIDPDVPNAQVGTQERPLLHQMIINIANGQTSTGQVVQPYMGPSPPDNKPHYYYFLLYQQLQDMDADKMALYAGQACPSSLTGRCLYNISGMVQDNNLRLVGASWMVAEKDDYVLYRQIQNNPNEVNTLCPGSCSKVCSAENIQSDVTSCLDQVKTGLTNKNSFYFGTQYSSLCGFGFASPMICYSANGSVVDSISTRVFPSRPGMDLTLLTKYLDMVFVVEPGNYTACGNTFVIDQTWTKRIDPTEAFVMSPAYSRYLPRLSWETTPGELYTLIVYDVGVSITHGIYININGNDIASSDIIDPYHGPLTTTTIIRNPYIFMVFRQTGGRLTLSKEWLDKINAYYGTVSYTIEEFADENNLIGPVAANWIEVVGDEYGAQSMYDQKVLVTCPLFVAKALSEKPRPFIPQPISLSVSIDVQFTPDRFAFTMCCKTHVLSAHTINTNPIGNGVVPTALVRSEVEPSIVYRKMGFYTTSTDFGNVKYTLVTLDPDVPNAQVGTEERPLLHQMIINIANGQTRTGRVVQPYMGPSPPDNKPHYYYFLLYQQLQDLDADKMTLYAGQACPSSLTGRCLYNISGMVKDNNLMLVGASWMVAEKDDYVLYRQIQSSPDNVDTLCQGQPGYSDPCVTAMATRISQGIFVVFTTIFLTLL